MGVAMKNMTTGVSACTMSCQVRAAGKLGGVSDTDPCRDERRPDETHRLRGYSPGNPVSDHTAQGHREGKFHQAENDEVGDHDPAEQSQAQLAPITGHPVIAGGDKPEDHAALHGGHRAAKRRPSGTILSVAPGLSVPVALPPVPRRCGLPHQRG